MAMLWNVIVVEVGHLQGGSRCRKQRKLREIAFGL